MPLAPSFINETSAINPATAHFELLTAQGQLLRLSHASIMGVINMSPNSFFQPCTSVPEAVDVVANMVTQGASIIDVGGEATSLQVNLAMDQPSLTQELDRVIPLIEQVKQRFDVLVSVDTSRPEVMHAAVAAGADMINDQRMLRAPGAMTTLAALQVPVCIMHFFQQPRLPGTTSLPALLQQITDELTETVQHCLLAGINPQRIILDPGFGQGNYGKNSAENYYLLKQLPVLAALGYPLLVGWSRKSMIRDVLDGAPPEARLFGSIAAATIAALQGAAIIRTHDVGATLDAIKVVRALP